MKITIKVDGGLCSGHARCAAKGPDVYDLDDEGFCKSDGKVITDAALREQVTRGMRACPERAITIDEA